jgi:hypothetical protein
MRRYIMILLACVTTPCFAQGWDADSAVREFSWGPVNVLVIADTVTGLGLWAATSSTAYHGDRHEFGASFNPDSVDLWLDQAHAVITHDTAAGASPATELRTTTLTALDSSAIVLLRERIASRWSDQTELVFLDRARKSLWSVAATADEANALVTSLFVQATRSRLASPDSSATASDPGQEDEAPRLIRARPVRPPKSLAGISASVTIRFVIGIDGKPERASFRTISYSDPRFVDAAIATLIHSRYTPGRLNGVPVRTSVVQTVTFDGRTPSEKLDHFPQPRPQVGDIWASPPF